MWWNRKKREIVKIEQARPVIPPKPKQEWVNVDYNLIYHFTDRKDYTYLYRGSYITQESYDAIWKWEMTQAMYMIVSSLYFYESVGRYTVLISTGEAIQKVIANGIWIENEFIAPNRITGCTRVEVDSKKEV